MNGRLNYSFDVDLAVQYSIEEALLINHFSFWIRQNEASGKNKHDGRTWMYQTQKDIAAIYPFWSEDTVHRLINKLVEKGVLIKGNYNKTSFDKTIWYAFKNKEILTKRDIAESDSAISRDQSHDIAEPIPDIKTYIKKNPPPLTPPSKEVELKEEEDFLFLSEFNLSPLNLRKLSVFPAEKVKEAIDHVYSNKKIKDKVAYALKMLNHPDDFKISQIDNLTPQQRLALNHNEFLKDFLPEEVYKENIQTIKSDKYFVIRVNSIGKPFTWSCKDSISEKELREDIRQDILLRKKK